jgi:hydrogenase maturation protein HypF
MTNSENIVAETIRVNGTVQGVGFRPTVWRLARAHNLTGSVWNDADGVGIQVWGDTRQLEGFISSLQRECPPLARIESIERSPMAAGQVPEMFRIVASLAGETQTNVAADAATCDACLHEVDNPSDRRFRYPFTNCTHCGPRLSIIRTIPYDRANTSMSAFPMCPACEAEYRDPADRRFHAQPNACPVCGPKVWLENLAGEIVRMGAAEDAVSAAQKILASGKIIALKGIGGIHLACDACNEQAVHRLRQRKRRYHKAFALMAKDVAMIQRFAAINEQEMSLLKRAAAPIVVLDSSGETVASEVAPGQSTLGFMLPYTPLHHLLMQKMEQPVVLTSGNCSDEPQCIENDDARSRLAHIADYLLLHDRDIVNRLDDSVARIAAGEPRLLRRARGYAPVPIVLPEGFERSGEVLAMGGELKNTFCLLQRGKAVLSQHMGDLENALTFKDYRHNLRLYRTLFDHRPAIIAVDCHPDYLSTQLGREMALAEEIRVVDVQHHHAHIAACMAEHAVPLYSKPVLGVVMDGLGYGSDGSLWGGEFLLADYRDSQRLAHFTPVAMPGGIKAMKEPWRNTYAHLQQAFGWDWIRENYSHLTMVRIMEKRPLRNLSLMIEQGLNSPLASSCGRLFDAVAATLGICVESQHFEGQAAMEMESIAAPFFQAQYASAYPFELPQPEHQSGIIHFRSLWRALLEDLAEGCDIGVVAARFPQTLCSLIDQTAVDLCRKHGITTVVLSGGVFQNRLLLEGVTGRLDARGLRVLSPSAIPANDGGLCLGQAVIAAAKAMSKSEIKHEY